MKIYIQLFATLLAVAVIVGAGCKTTSSTTNTTSTTNLNSEAAGPVNSSVNSAVNTSNNNEETEEETTNVNQEDESESTDEADDATTTAVEGAYQEYTASAVSQAQHENIVLFFHAPWCPTCKLLDSDLIDQADSIPSDLLILQVDYDSATELRKQYGITYQHTLVQVDAQGNQITKWSGGNTLQSILDKLK